MKLAKLLLLSPLVLILSSQALLCQNSDQDIKDFDKKVAAMQPVSGSMKVNIEVIGLEIKQNSQVKTQLSKIASAGGGKYHDVQQAKDLSKTFTSVTTDSAQNRVAPQVKGPEVNLSRQEQERLAMVLVEEGRRLEADGKIREAILKYQQSLKYKFKIDQLIALRIRTLKKKIK